VTEHSSDDEDHFVDTRTAPNTTTNTSVMSTTNTNNSVGKNQSNQPPS